MTPTVHFDFWGDALVVTLSDNRGKPLMQTMLKSREALELARQINEEFAKVEETDTPAFTRWDLLELEEAPCAAI